MRKTVLCLSLCACAPASVSSLVDAAGGGAMSPDGAPSNDAGARSDAAAPGADVGASTDVSWPLGEPAWVDVDVRTNGRCPELNACGGDVVGTWDVAGVCIEVPVEETLMRCPGARVARRSGRARGRVSFGERLAVRRAEWSVEVQTIIPAVCAAFVGGCDGIQAGLRLLARDSTCQASMAGDCDCVARQSGAINDADGYSTSGGQIVSATLTRRWDYCVGDGALRYRDANAQAPAEPGTITLRRR